MADHTLGGVALASGRLRLPRRGLWTANVRLADGAAPSVGNRLELVVGGVARACAVRASNSASPRPTVALVGGRGLVDAPVPTKPYRGESAARIALDALGEAGEAKGDWAPADVFCAHWTRPQGSCRDVLARVVRAADPTGTRGLGWRVQDDGAISAVLDAPGAEWPSSGTAGRDFVIAEWVDDHAEIVVAVTSSTLLPGSSVQLRRGDDRNVDAVEYYFGDGAFEAMLRFV